MNEVLRGEYSEDAQRGVDKWNRVIEGHGIDFKFKLPNRRFHRAAGIYAGLHFDLEGNPMSNAEWEKKKGDWLPTEADDAYVESLMTEPVYDPKGMANWIAPPARGIRGKPVDYEYVKRAN